MKHHAGRPRDPRRDRPPRELLARRQGDAQSAVGGELRGAAASRRPRGHALRSHRPPCGADRRRGASCSKRRASCSRARGASRRSRRASRGLGAARGGGDRRHPADGAHHARAAADGGRRGAHAHPGEGRVPRRRAGSLREGRRRRHGRQGLHAQRSDRRSTRCRRWRSCSSRPRAIRSQRRRAAHAGGPAGHVELTVHDSSESKRLVDARLFGGPRVFFLSRLRTKKQADRDGARLRLDAAPPRAQESRARRAARDPYEGGARYEFTPTLVHPKGRPLGRAGAMFLRLLTGDAAANDLQPRARLAPLGGKARKNRAARAHGGSARSRG